jgi:hypothetical protein
MVHQVRISARDPLGSSPEISCSLAAPAFGLFGAAKPAEPAAASTKEGEKPKEAAGMLVSSGADAVR